MRLLVRGLWFGSLAGFLFTLFSAYLNVRNLLGIQIDSIVFTTNRDGFFFGFLALFTLINLLFFAYSRVIFTIPNRLLLIPNRQFWTHTKHHRAALNQIFSHASWVVAATVNYFLCYWLLVVKHENHFEGGKLPEVAWFYWPGIVMLISLLTVPLRLLVKNPNLLARRDGDQ